LVFNYNSFNSCFSDKLWEPDRLGVAGAGIAFCTQEVIASFAGC
jgi:hypothetical protein